MSYNALVTLARTVTPLPANTVFGHTNLTVTDSAGAVQNLVLNGSETPPWTLVVAVAADGASSYSAQDVDANGAPIGSPQTTSYTPTVPTYPALSGITVAPA